MYNNLIDINKTKLSSDLLQKLFSSDIIELKYDSTCEGNESGFIVPPYNKYIISIGGHRNLINIETLILHEMAHFIHAPQHKFMLPNFGLPNETNELFSFSLNTDYISWDFYIKNESDLAVKNELEVFYIQYALTAYCYGSNSSMIQEVPKIVYAEHKSAQVISMLYKMFLDYIKKNSIQKYKIDYILNEWNKRISILENSERN